MEIRRERCEDGLSLSRTDTVTACDRSNPDSSRDAKRLSHTHTPNLVIATVWFCSELHPMDMHIRSRLAKGMARLTTFQYRKNDKLLEIQTPSFLLHTRRGIPEILMELVDYLSITAVSIPIGDLYVDEYIYFHFLKANI